MADLAVGQLRVWHDWDAVEQVSACYQDPKTFNTIKRAVVFYLMDLVASADEADVERRDLAKQHLAKLDQVDRDAFRKAERMYFKFFGE